MSITSISATIFRKNESRNNCKEQTIKQNEKKYKLRFKTKNLKD